MQLLTHLNWRYAVKKYTNQPVSQAKLTAILEAINLSATSAGIQPFRLILVEDPSLRQRLGENSFNAQIAQAPHLLVFAAFTDVTQAHIDEYMHRIAAVRDVPVASLTDFKTALESAFLSRTTEQNFQWSARQAYIGLGTALIAAAAEEVDSTPMEGFDSAVVDSALGLPERGLKSVVMLALGYRDEEQDAFARLKKVRLPLHEFVTTNG